MDRTPNPRQPPQIPPSQEISRVRARTLPAGGCTAYGLPSTMTSAARSSDRSASVPTGRTTSMRVASAAAETVTAGAVAGGGTSSWSSSAGLSRSCQEAYSPLIVWSGLPEGATVSGLPA
ncbi:hypothetical protein GCM10018987_53740 [Streptomyces cremeus]